MTRRTYLWLECLALFGLTPVVLTMFPMQGALFAVLWLSAMLCVISWKRQTGLTIRSQLSLQSVECEHWRDMLRRFLFAAIAMSLFVWFHDRERLFSLLLERTNIWIMVMCLYPLLSVFPQEVIYRLFFHRRYGEIFRDHNALILFGGLAFGHGHILLNNVVAYLMSIIGGCLFAYSYKQTGSLSFVWIEHALYGCFVFTIGLGWYFYTGAAHLH